MKKTQDIMYLSRHSLRRLALGTALAVGLGSGAAFADTEIEYDAEKGYHEEEWYDPGDWFNDDNQISYESDTDWSDTYWDDTYDTYGLYDPVGYVYYYWDPVETDWTEDTSNQQQASNRNNRSSDRQTARLQGTIDGFRQVDLTDQKGVKESHSFVKVNLQDGKSRVISLGSDKSVGELDLEKGDRISVSGPVAKVDGRKVILANRIRTGGETFRVQDRNQPDLSQNSQQNRSNQNPITRRGTLEDVTKVDLDNQQREDNLVVRLEMKDGRSCVADLGAGTELSDLNLDKGDTVWIQGDRKKVDGKTLIVAKKIRVEGDQTRLRGSGSQQGSSARNSQSQDERSQASARND